MQSNPIGRGDYRHKRSSLVSNREDRTKKSKTDTNESISIATGYVQENLEDHEVVQVVGLNAKKQPSPHPSLEILEHEYSVGATGNVVQDQAISMPVMKGASSMPPMSPSVNKSGSSRLNYHLPLRTDSWIEDTPFKVPPKKELWFGSSGGEPTDPYYPNIDLLSGESVATDSAKDGGDLGYCVFRDMMTTTDRLKGVIEALAAQHFNDLYKLCYQHFIICVFIPCYCNIYISFLFRQYSLAWTCTTCTGGTSFS